MKFGCNSWLSPSAYGIAVTGSVILFGGCAAQSPIDDSAPHPAEVSRTDPDTPQLQKPGEKYKTPLAGEGFKTKVLGEAVTVEPQSLRSISAWDAGLSGNPGLSQNEITPFGSIYLLRNSDDDHFFRATLAGLYNDAFYAHSPRNWGNFETVFTFENFTIPFDQAEFIDGEKIQGEELTWGYARAGLGLGLRDRTAPGGPDNMRSMSLSVEPGYLYFGSGSDADDNFITPDSTQETRLHLSGRWDSLERNLLKLAHKGFTVGADLLAARRSHWDDWGRDGQESGSGHRDYTLATAYVRGAGPLPGVDSDRHRLLASFHGGAGNDLDRFSAPRIDGGPQADELGAAARPVIPGAAVREFYPTHYAIVTGEYRYEPIFFSYIGMVGSLAWLDRERLVGDSEDEFRTDDDLLGSIGLRLTTGFLGGTRLQVESNYNSDLVRDGDSGGYNTMLHLSGDF